MPSVEFRASMADVTDEEHQNMAGLVQPEDFNAGVIVRFLRDNGIDACIEESGNGFRYTLADPARESQVRFACVCLRVDQILDRGSILVYGGEAMRSKCSRPPVEPLSARILRLRIARGYSADELAAVAQVPPGAIRRLEAGKPVDKSVLPALAAALGVSFCFLICGEHSCAERACVSPLLIYKPGVIVSFAAHAGHKAALRRRHLPERTGL